MDINGVVFDSIHSIQDPKPCSNAKNEIKK